MLLKWQSCIRYLARFGDIQNINIKKILSTFSRCRGSSGDFWRMIEKKSFFLAVFFPKKMVLATEYSFSKIFFAKCRNFGTEIK
jgi:hypothetical protein